MNITRREMLLSSVALAATGCITQNTSATTNSVVTAKEFYLGYKFDLILPRVDVPSPVKICVIGDTHFGFHDERDNEFADYYKRMAQWPAAKDSLAKALTRAQKEKADLIALVGDNISFPTLANIEFLKKSLDECGLPWMYISGNHDWHFEGVKGSDIAQRAEWAPKRLASLYQGATPLYSSRVVKGVRCVMIDNSVYHILPEQLEFWKQEAAKGDPIALFMHIPLWAPNWSLHTCGCPEWGAATDPYWEIERREKWAEKQMPESFAFRDAVLSTPNLVGVFTGHIHRLMVAQVRNQLMFSVPSNRDGSSLMVTIGGAQCK